MILLEQNFEIYSCRSGPLSFPASVLGLHFRLNIFVLNA